LSHGEALPTISKKAGWSWGCVSAIDANERTIWVADAHSDGGKRFIVRADEKLTAFVELERAVTRRSLQPSSSQFVLPSWRDFGKTSTNRGLDRGEGASPGSFFPRLDQLSRKN